MEFSLPAVLAGVVAGMLTGMLPGIHVNTITALLLAATAAGFAGSLDFATVSTFICAMAIAHTFFDVIPGLFLGVPNDTAFALLPGHRLVGQGRGREAVRLSMAGSLVGLFIGLLAVALLLQQLGNAGDNPLLALNRVVSDWIFYVLAAICLILVISETNKLAALTSFLLSGLLGVIAFGSPLIPGGTGSAINLLFPVLAGMFGLAGLFYAIHTYQPRDKNLTFGNEKPVKLKTLVVPSASGGIAGGIVGLLPGLGVANAATLLLLLERLPWGKRRSLDESDRRYLVTTSALNTSEAIFAIVALFLIGKSRSGASVALDQVLGQISADDIWSIALVFLVAGCIAAVVLLLLARPLASGFARLDARRLSLAVIVFILLLIGLLMGSGGLLMLAVATLVGLVPIYTGARRAQLMGFFLVPVMLFYSGHQAGFVSALHLEQRLSASPGNPDTYSIIAVVLFALLMAPVTYLLARHKIFQWSGRQLWYALAILMLAPLVWHVFLASPVRHPSPQQVDTNESWRPVQLLRVIDGDTLVLSANARRYRVRLARIDAPETHQPGGAEATWFVQELLDSKSLEWHVVGVDIYGRMLAEVRADGTSLNEQLVANGHAWVYSQFRSTEPQLIELEQQARQQALGLWQQDSPLPPWQWRRLH